MSESKTAREWFLQAKAEGYKWADEALREYEAKPLYDKDENFCTMDSAIFDAFDWRTTSAGHDFWKKVYLDLRNSKYLSPA